MHIYPPDFLGKGQGREQLPHRGCRSLTAAALPRTGVCQKNLIQSLLSAPQTTKSFKKQILDLKNFPLPMDNVAFFTYKQFAMKTGLVQYTKCYRFSN